jgi:hypothetical protein
MTTYMRFCLYLEPIYQSLKCFEREVLEKIKHILCEMHVFRNSYGLRYN